MCIRDSNDDERASWNIFVIFSNFSWIAIDMCINSTLNTPTHYYLASVDLIKSSFNNKKKMGGRLTFKRGYTFTKSISAPCVKWGSREVVYPAIRELKPIASTSFSFQLAHIHTHTELSRTNKLFRDICLIYIYIYLAIYKRVWGWELVILSR